MWQTQYYVEQPEASVESSIRRNDPLKMACNVIFGKDTLKKPTINNVTSAGYHEIWGTHYPEILSLKNRDG